MAFPDAQEGLAEIGFVTTHPTYQGPGVATALMQHLLALPGYEEYVLRDFVDIAEWVTELQKPADGGGRELGASHVRGMHRVLSMALSWAVPKRIPANADRGKPLRLRNWRYREFAAARKAAGLDGTVLTPHKLRHTAASLAIAARADVYVVQRMLGHSKPSITLDVYGHLWPDRLDEVADALHADYRAAAGERSAA